MKKYLCIHGHFYQPPRENAWTGEIEQQESAAPFHDWNSRISAECYGPNAHSRILNEKKEITDLFDNYASISFNFGPTVLSWMEEHDKEAYKAIIASDEESKKRFNGHGSAIAQVFNHMIMPLCNTADKKTQIIWGIKDFEHRFKRAPEGMWLAEAAVDTETLDLMAEQGIKFTVLAPGSCKAVRKIGEKKWNNTDNASVDPKRGYLYNLPSGRSITLFFYDGPISQGIAFSDTLKSGENFSAKLLSTYRADSETQLMHIATDGETYGHHQKFADMALAYCLKNIEENKLAKVTVYADFMEQNPAEYECQINENTSWSCFHGVERWRADCGCNSGMHQGWHQKWRAPLRQALDFVREEINKTLDTIGREFYNDPWNARNNYVNVILNRSPEGIDKFLNENATDKGKNEKTRSLQIMEMAYHAMLMYTSCGWFFDEISGIETVQVMQYAKRAIDLNRIIASVDLEDNFKERLAQAPSNVDYFGNGGAIYEKMVKPCAFLADKAAFHYAVSLEYDREKDKVFTYNVEDVHVDDFKIENGSAIIGDAVFFNRITLESERKYFVVLNAHTYKLVCFVSSNLPLSHDEIKNILTTKNEKEAAEELEQKFEKKFTIQDAVKDLQTALVRQVIDETKAKTKEALEKTFAENYPILRDLKYIGNRLPKSFVVAAEFVFTEDIVQEIEKEDMDTAAVEELIEDAGSMGIGFDNKEIEDTLRLKLEELCKDFASDSSKEKARRVVRFLKDCQGLPFKLDIFYAQEVIFAAVKNLDAEVQHSSAVKVMCRLLQLCVPCK
ncbi:Glycosyl hydrolase family 57 [Parelusimicrobium proximum]|uniref:DUF3536 domain-containing protein n=1 Tax=Parelusimicrobium proximum TaxID=3228953 RepID=UPI003D167C57